MKQLLGLIFFLSPVLSLAQESAMGSDNTKEYVHYIGLRAGAAAMDSYLPETGLAFSFVYRYRLSRLFSLGARQGFIIQDNFPSNFYPPVTAPFHLPPQVDAYIRSLNFDEALDFSWSKTTLICLIPDVSFRIVRIGGIVLTIEAGLGVQYRNHSSFRLKSFTFQDNELVDYQELTQTNSVIAPVVNTGLVMSGAVSGTIKIQMVIGYNYELGNHENPKYYGPGDYAYLHAGFIKSF